MNQALYIVIRSCKVVWYLPFSEGVTTFERSFEDEIHLATFQTFLKDEFQDKIFISTHLIVADFPEMTNEEKDNYVHELSFYSKKAPIFVPFLDVFPRKDPIMVLFGDIETYGFLVTSHQIINYPSFDMGEGMMGSAKRMFFESMQYVSLNLSNVLEESNFIREIKHRFKIHNMEDLKRFISSAKQSDILQIANLTVHFGSINQHVYKNYSSRLDEIKNIALSLLKDIEISHLSLVFAGCFFKEDTLLKEEIIRHVSKIKHVDQILFVDEIIEEYIRRDIL